MHIDAAIRERRSHKVFAGEPLDPDILRDLIELACWAPNHGLTEPWRFHAALGPSKDRLRVAIDETLVAMRKPDAHSDEGRLAGKRRKMATRIDQAGAVVAVTCPNSVDEPVRAREDYAATCCAIQNLMLAATARGLASYWSTGKALDRTTVRTFWGLADDMVLVGTLFLGAPAHSMRGRRQLGVDDVLRLV